MVSRPAVVSEKANTHVWPVRGPSTVILPKPTEILTVCPLTLKLSCLHTFTFHYEFQGPTNINCNEFLTVPPHLTVKRLVLCYRRP